MTEIRTIQDYKRFIDEMAPFHKPDNLMINFIHSFNSIAVGCSCKRKARIRANYFWKPLHLQKPYQSSMKNNLKHIDEIQERLKMICQL